MSNDKEKNNFRPLADRMRPTTLDGFVGQEHLLGEGRPLRRYIDSAISKQSTLFRKCPSRAKTGLSATPPGTSASTCGP